MPVSVSRGEAQISCFYCASFPGKRRFRAIFFGKAQKCGKEAQIFGKAQKCLVGKCRCISALSQKGNPPKNGKAQTLGKCRWESTGVSDSRCRKFFPGVGFWESPDSQSGKMGFLQWESAENYLLFLGKCRFHNHDKLDLCFLNIET